MNNLKIEGEIRAPCGWKKIIYFEVLTDVQQFIWHTSQATLTQHVRQASGKTQALKGVMKTMAIIGEHTGDQPIYATRQNMTHECQNNCLNEGLFRGFRSRSVIGLIRRFGRTYCLHPCGDWIWFGWKFKWLWGKKYVGYMGWLANKC